MTDKELVLELCKRLNLKETTTSKRGIPGHKEYCQEPKSIVLGAGEGHMFFFTCFDFDGDKLVGHGVWE